MTRRLRRLLQLRFATLSNQASMESKVRILSPDTENPDAEVRVSMLNGGPWRMTRRLRRLLQLRFATLSNQASMESKVRILPP